ncbi:DNA primase, partial [Pantanalinema rosaneae CENA516]|uniref:DNA primase n=1 Tax=Pantanalinema rosaneae TaxID=1620701 RepID=UPI003D6F978F
MCIRDSPMDIPRLHPDTIEHVKQRTDIVDVVSEHVVLRKRGKDFVGLCPFHDDKSPSFTVSPSKQFYFCFSCGAGGNAIKFLMELGKRSFADVVVELARRYQVPVETLKVEDRQEFQRQLSVREQLYEIVAVAAKFFEHALFQPQGQAALEYVQSQRRLSPETIQQFQLGYAPAGWETLYGYLVEQKHYPVQLVEQAGLIVPRKVENSPHPDGSQDTKGMRGYYDRFRDRLIIPIHDLQGRVVGFGGRTLGDEQPKYLNSPQTELFDKGKLLFALDKARATIAKQDRAVVVEGYFDVIALHNAGITNAVASMGTALSTAQVKQLLRYTESKRIVLNFDADRAGNQAAERAVNEVEAMAYRGDIQLRVLNLPSGKDPDEFLRIHPVTTYRTLLDEAPLWIDWQIQQAIAGKDLKQADQFQACVQTIVKLLGNLPNATLRTHYIHQCAELLSQGDSRLALRLEEDLRLQVRGERWHGRSQKWQTTRDRTLLEEAEAQLLRLYLHVPRCRNEITTALEDHDLDFSLSHHRFLWRQILELEDSNNTQSSASTSDPTLPISLTSPTFPTSLTVLSPDTAPPDLLSQLQDRCTEFPAEMARVYYLFHPDEKTKLDLVRASLIIRAATATMERVMCEKRCRHFQTLWEQTDTAAAPELGLWYQQRIYSEKLRIAEIDQQLRQVTLTDLIQTPWFGEV